MVDGEQRVLVMGHMTVVHAGVRPAGVVAWVVSRLMDGVARVARVSYHTVR